MYATPRNVQVIAQGLDHPEGLNFGADGFLYAGGEAGQIYRIDPGNGAVDQYASTSEGLILGVTLDGHGNLYACHVGRGEIVKVGTEGSVSCYSRGIDGQPLVNPNYAVFDSRGNLYYSDSGNYFEPTGALYVVRPSGATELFHSGPLAFPNGLAIDANEEFLYIAQSTAPNVIRLPLANDLATTVEPEPYVTLEPGAVPDGLAFDREGQLIIACYVPDRILIAGADRRVRVLVDDPGAELLNRPTNVALADGRLYFANLGGWHIGSVAFDGQPMPLRYPRLS